MLTDYAVLSAAQANKLVEDDDDDDSCSSSGNNNNNIMEMIVNVTAA
jgi:hypothetical protein